MRSVLRFLSVAAVLAIFFTATAVALSDSASTGATGATSATGVTSACPAAAPNPAPKSSVTGAAQELVPGTPTGALLCRYNGLPEPGVALAGFTLMGQARLSGSATTALSRQFNALPAIPSGSSACPDDSGTAAVVYFRYADGAVDPLQVALSGCSSSSNGVRERAGFPAGVTRLTRGSAAFVKAHEGTVDLQIDGRTNDLYVRVESTDHDVVADCAVPADGDRDVLVTPGEDTITLQRGDVHPQTLGSTSVAAKAGASVIVRLSADK